MQGPWFETLEPRDLEPDPQGAPARPHGPLPDGDDRVPEPGQHAEQDERRDQDDEDGVEDDENGCADHGPAGL
jgi:hypothetical protein